MRDAFAENLVYLCGLHASTAEVCRRLGINRQQFNKYLAGASRPSRHNMRRICDLWGVTEAEILSEPLQFRELVSLRRQPAGDGALPEIYAHVERLFRASAPLDRYVGYYYRYFYSFGRPGRITRSLASIARVDGRYLWKNVERARLREGEPKHSVAKYAGAAFLLANRIHIVEHEALMQSSITQMTLYPSYRVDVGDLLGIQTGGPVRRGRQPGASRVLLRYLGRRIDTRKALRATGIFDPAEIDPTVASLVRNEIPTTAYVLEVEQQ